MQRLRIIYTALLRADLALLPCLFTMIQQVRRQNPADAVLLMDIGEAWSADSWLCQATENRAIYILLDAMGYAVAHADGLVPEWRAALQQIVQVQLMGNDGQYIWKWRDIQVNIGGNAPAPAVSWQCCASSDTLYQVESGQIVLHPLRHDLGWIDVQYPSMQVVEYADMMVDRNGMPDPTITAAIDFVEREARAYDKKG